MREWDELRDRVEAKRKRLEARIAELRADTRAEARAERARLEKRLEHLAASLQGGWESLTDEAARTLNAWLKED